MNTDRVNYIKAVSAVNIPPTKDEIIEDLKAKLKEVRIQRNNYEQEVFALRKENARLAEENKNFTNYINRSNE